MTPEAVAPDDSDAMMILGVPALAQLAPFGTERDVVAGDDAVPRRRPDARLLRRPRGRGRDRPPRRADGDVVVATHGPRRFLGELNLLTGQRAFLTARVTEPGRVLVIPQPAFRQLMSTKPDFSDTIFRALVARRELLRTGEGARADPHHRFALLARGDGAARVREPVAPPAHVDRPRGHRRPAGRPREHRGAPDDVPVVITPTAVLRRPTPGEFAAHLGLTYRADARATSAISSWSGTGPAGLAAAVYGASEGLETVALDAVGVGGQAGASSRIENYVGFPNGISGDDLVAAAAIQAHAPRRAPQRAVRGRGPARRARASTWSCSPTAARSRRAR